MLTRARTYLLALVTGMSLAACAVQRVTERIEPEGVSAKVRAEAFIEYGELVDLIVGVRAARYRDGSGYLPLEVAINNHGPRTYPLTRQSFTLVDSEGVRYDAARPQDLLDGYDFLDMDRAAFSDLAGVAASTFGAAQRHPSKLSPTREIVRADRYTLNVVQDTILLRRLTYAVDYLYFPEPASGIKNHWFDLVHVSEDLRDSVVVRFVVQ